MKTSIFTNWEIAIWIDYSKRKDCSWVFDLSEDDIKKIKKWAWIEVIDWDYIIVDTEEYLENINQENIEKEKLEKQIVISKYKDIQKSIVDIKSELQEINDTYESYNETWKSIADLRKVSLNERLINLRLEKDELVLSWIEKYWIEIQNEF